MEKVGHIISTNMLCPDQQCKSRFDAAAEELERLLVSKEGENFKDAGMRNAVNNGQSGGPGSGGGKRALGKAMKTGGMLFKGKGAGSIQKQEDDIRARLGTANDAFRKSVQDYQTLRQEYFNFQLPKILRVSRENWSLQALMYAAFEGGSR
jgi:hypothetical protein